MVAGRFDVVGIGRCSIDFLGVISGPPRPDSKHRFERFEIQGGGPAATAMVTLQRLGLRTAFIGKVGRDFFGEFMIDSLAAEGVEVRGVRRADQGISQFANIVIERETGARTIFWSDGEIPPLAPEELPRELLQGIRALHVDGHHIPAALAAAEEVRARGGLISYDAGTLRPGAEQLARLSDLLFATPGFARDLTGARDPDSMARALHSLGADWAGVTLGDQGAVGYDGRELIRAPAFTVRVVDTTGAGDVFHGALLYARLAGWPLRRALTFANAVAALKCRALGGRRAIPGLAEALAFAGLPPTAESASQGA
jgi:sugar/nucleoside kinase (ribokinase family)